MLLESVPDLGSLDDNNPKNALPRFEDKYEKGALIGHGNTGVVYAVTLKQGSTHGHETVQLACKEILLEEQGISDTVSPNEAMHDSAASVEAGHIDVQRVSVTKAMKELKLLLTLRHPNLIELHDFWVEHNSCKLVMTRLTGGELSDIVQAQGKLSEDDARAAVIGILSGVSHMHTKGIAHRDLKLENVLLVEGRPLSEVKIADFGMAKRIRAGASAHTMCGSPMYVAPEVLIVAAKDHNGKNVAAYDLQADVWSIGVMLYLMLSGHPPFDTKGGLYPLFQQIKRGMYRSLRSSAWDG
eukprot:scaffold258858_cov47-Prasinocladus_malaysianus.AAC.1